MKSLYGYDSMKKIVVVTTFRMKSQSKREWSMRIDYERSTFRRPSHLQARLWKMVIWPRWAAILRILTTASGGSKCWSSRLACLDWSFAELFTSTLDSRFTTGKLFSSFLRFQDESDMSKTNLAKGCPNPFVIWMAATIRIYATFIAISLLRSSSSQSVPEGWDGMCDLNKHCGSEFSYLVWRRMPTSVTTILPHRSVEDIVVCSFNLPTNYLYFTGLLYRLNPFSPGRRWNLGIREKQSFFKHQRGIQWRLVG